MDDEVTLRYSYGRGRHETKRGDRKAAADVLRVARAHPKLFGIQRKEPGYIIVRQPSIGLVLHISFRSKS